MSVSQEQNQSHELQNETEKVEQVDTEAHTSNSEHNLTEKREHNREEILVDDANCNELENPSKAISIAYNHFQEQQNRVITESPIESIIESACHQTSAPLLSLERTQIKDVGNVMSSFEDEEGQRLLRTKFPRLRRIILVMNNSENVSNEFSRSSVVTEAKHEEEGNDLVNESTVMFDQKSQQKTEIDYEEKNHNCIDGQPSNEKDKKLLEESELSSKRTSRRRGGLKRKKETPEENAQDMQPNKQTSNEEKKNRE